MRSKHTICFAVMAGAFGGLASATKAQSFAIGWFTIDGGGAVSSSARYSLTGTVAQPDAGALTGPRFGVSGGFWPGASGEPSCHGGERIAKASCQDRNGSNQLKVSLSSGLEGDAFTVTLTDGSQKSGTINGRGKGKAKFNNRPAGDSGTAAAEWGCGATDEKAYSCP